MSDMKLFLELMVKNSSFRSGLDNSGRDVSRFSQGARREMDALKGSVRSVQGMLAGLGISYGVLQNQTASARLDKGLIQLKQTAGETIEMTRVLRKEFFRMGGETGRDVEKLKDGFDSLIQSGQSWKSARESTGAINIASAVSGANEKTLAGGLTVGASAFNIDLEKPGQALELLDKMVVAGRLGNAELESLSDIFARVGVNAKETGFGFEPTLAFIEALSMVERAPERLATLADSTLRVFTNSKYLTEAQKGTGVKFFDDKGGRRDPVAVLEDIRKKYALLKTDAQRASFMQAGFGHADLDTIKGLRSLFSGNSLGKVTDFTVQIENAGGTLRRDLPEAISNAVDQTGRLKVALREAGDELAQPINKAIADLIQHSLGKKQDGGLELSGKEMIAIGGAALVSAAVVKRFGPKMLKGLIGGAANTAEGVVMGKALEKIAGVTPVFVTNWPDNMGGSSVADAVGGVLGGGGVAAGGKKAAGAGARAAKALIRSSMVVGAAELGGTVLPYTAALLGGYAVGTGVNHGLGWIRSKTSDGKYSGPGWMGEEIYDAFHPEQLRRDVFNNSNVKNNINLQVTIDKSGRVVAISDHMDTRINVDHTVQRGSFDDAILRPNL